MSEQVHWFMDVGGAALLFAGTPKLVNRRPPEKDGADIILLCRSPIQLAYSYYCKCFLACLPTYFSYHSLRLDGAASDCGSLL